MRKWVKFFKNLKSLKKLSIFNKYFLRTSKKSYLEKPFFIKTNFKIFTAGNIEFSIFFSSVIFWLYYLHKNIHKYNETVRLVAAGITTHILVDFATYIGDKINTKVKVESFYIKKTVHKDINYFFDKTFLHFKKNKLFKRHRHLNQKSLGTYLGDLHFRGLQAAMVFVVINSILFYGLYKNLKHFIKENFNIDGFFNFFLAAGIAQFVAMVFAFPLENIKTRMQASNFSYDSLFKYYKKLIKGKPMNVIVSNFKNEYSGFVSHLLLYVVYESVTFGIYESMMKLKIFKKEKGEAGSNNEGEGHSEIAPHHDIHEVNFYAVVIASCLSGLIAAIVTNPIDVYQINKQINPKFSTSQLNRWNILTGMKERIIFITFLNLITFLSLESIGPKYFDVRLE
jgi:hypothetical protein